MRRTAPSPGNSKPKIAPPAETVTVTVRSTAPPAPLHLNVNVLVTLSGPRVSLPDTALLPDQAPEAAHAVAFVEIQLNIVEAFALTVAGTALSVSVGAALATVTVAEPPALPPAPVQVREYVLVLVNAAVGWLPIVGLLPDHAPEAVQEFALVDDHAITDEPPLATVAGFAAIDTVGAGDGVGKGEDAGAGDDDCGDAGVLIGAPRSLQAAPTAVNAAIRAAMSRQPRCSRTDVFGTCAPHVVREPAAMIAGATAPPKGGLFSSNPVAASWRAAQESARSIGDQEASCGAARRRYACPNASKMASEVVTQPNTFAKLQSVACRQKSGPAWFIASSTRIGQNSSK
jgi:hypothetical protein